VEGCLRLEVVNVFDVMSLLVGRGYISYTLVLVLILAEPSKPPRRSRAIEAESA